MHKVLTIENLPESGIEASAEFFVKHLAQVRALLKQTGTASLTIVLPAAPASHDDWRTALARDLAREYAPKRVNLVGGAGEGVNAALTYLGDASGVTGQYCPLHDQ